ncbi:hypothetical protein F0P96_05800 [Hymenobacter busanensis]|uniref:DUF2268 domain-containing protein n=1 Tax=Hymenobacter busanensis TaxID=2607656 RepID=A0A7L5A1R8_9BACT|nr:DUF2268 domain-containing putative Zn-dependent protease [Hymenobacter busanensis]KAA9338347.1 hypothetical protein F0P96_05800 [Hymenobacter busanensis]QHJ09227.1 hypothetical protein GUY19_18810 [Hymenobacter busanensis]
MHYRNASLAAALWASLACSQAAKSQTLPATPPLDSLRAQAKRSAAAKSYPEAAARYQRLAGAEPHRLARASALYNAACYYALAGQPQPALQQLAAAQQAGFNQAEHVRKDADLASLRTTSGFAKIVKRMDQATAREADPRKVRLVTSDIDNFWRAYDLAARDTAQRHAIFQREYFDKASVGLEDYFDRKIHSVARFVRNLDQKPNFYRSIRPTTQQIAGFKPQMQANFRKIKELYPAARFPDVYFVIGRFSSAGTVSPNGLLLGADQLSNGPGVPLDELSVRGRAILSPVALVPVIVAHEHIHYIQKDSPDLTLLRGAINEGMADFLAEVVTGTNPNARIHAYGNAHEAEIWADFKKEMTSTNWNNWIGNGGQETAAKPADLGYYVGYRICQAYYAKAADKKQAIQEILNIGSYPEFLEKSGYEKGLAAR